MKKGLCVCAAILFAALGAAGCGADEKPAKEKVLRVLGPDFKYETAHYEHTAENISTVQRKSSERAPGSPF